jgi:hypothetical protein
MTNSCAFKLTRRWMLLLFLLAMAGYTIYYLVSGSLPATTYRVDFSLDNTRTPMLQLPRLIDPLFAVMTLGAVIFITFAQDARDNLRRATYGRAHIKSSTSIGWGWFFGICGSILVLFGGLSVAIIGSTIASICISGFTISWYKEKDEEGWSRLGERALAQSALIDWIALLIILATTTYFHGVVAGTTYALAMLLCCFVAHGLTTGGWALCTHTGPKFLTKFRRTMLECDIESEAC